MITATLLSFVLLSAVQTPPANPACALLTSAEAASLVGEGGKFLGVTAAPGGATCLVQNGDNVATILTATLASADAATGLWEAKKRIVSGKDLAGWPAKAYAGTLKDTSAVGVTKGITFIEVRVIDAKQTDTELAAKLETVMKAVAGRMP